MEMPHELVVWYLLPALRKQLVLELQQQGLNQKQIASKLDITSAAVSQYLHNKRANNSIFITDKLKKEINSSASKIIKSPGPKISSKELIRLVNVSMTEGILCDKCGLKTKNCNICVKQ